MTSTTIRFQETATLMQNAKQLLNKVKISRSSKNSRVLLNEPIPPKPKVEIKASRLHLANKPINSQNKSKSTESQSRIYK
jgi:hypothetical protein